MKSFFSPKQIVMDKIDDLICKIDEDNYLSQAKYENMTPPLELRRKVLKNEGKIEGLRIALKYIEKYIREK